MKRQQFVSGGALAALLTALVQCLAQSTKPAISLDEFLNTTEIRDARIAPDGSAAVIATSAPDWKLNRFREDLWIWNERNTKAVPLTRTGHESSPQWSPDGKFIAFISDRELPDDVDSSDDDGPKASGAEGEGASRLWLIDPKGGEAFPAYREKVNVHSFAWAPDSAALYFSIQEPLSKAEKQTSKDDWKDVIRWREQERGDLLLRISLPDMLRADQPRSPKEHQGDTKKASEVTYPASTTVIARSKYEIEQVIASPDGKQIAFHTQSISHRLERPEDYEIYVVAVSGGEARQVTHNQALEKSLHWSPDSRTIYFLVGAAGGSAEGAYQDVQGRLYSVDAKSGSTERLGDEFQGSWESFELLPDGSLLAVGLQGLEAQLYSVNGKHFEKQSGVSGTYSGLATGLHGTRILLVHSSIDQPAQVYMADDEQHLTKAVQLSDFNSVFQQRALPQWKPYKWKAADGASVEGVLLYPPGKLGQRNLKMLTLIHGGPADADGNRFGADWYDWAGLAAANGWLVFRPNYRGSSGYGDQFMLQIAPHLVSEPGKDILAGVDALVKDGIADPQHLAIGGYSYGGYMTNWLITQTTRFRSAVTGAGAVEHAANWGNDDLTFDDAWYLSGTPWQKPELFQSEAALFQFDKVKTPTHLVAGNADVRVSYLEAVLMERALQKLDIPHSLLVFPGEGHPLDKNPWHGYIKVREELKWLEHYDH